MGFKLSIIKLFLMMEGIITSIVIARVIMEEVIKIKITMGSATNLNWHIKLVIIIAPNLLKLKRAIINCIVTIKLMLEFKGVNKPFTQIAIELQIEGLI